MESIMENTSIAHPNASSIFITAGPATSNYRVCPARGNVTATEDPDPTALLAYSGAVLLTSTLGILGNLLSGIVLNLPSMRSSYTLLLTALTISDTLQLLQDWIFVGSTALNKLGLKIKVMEKHPEVAIIMALIGWIAFTASTYLTVLVSFERYIAICKPFQSLRIFPSKRRTLYYVSAIMGFSVLFNLPKWWQQEPCVEILGQIHKSEINSDCYGDRCDANLTQESQWERRRITLTDLADNNVYSILYVNCANILVNFLIPLVVLVVLNINIYVGMLKATKRQIELIPGGRGPDNSITSMLIVVVAVFCCCQIWYPVDRLIHIWCKACRKHLSRIYTYLYCFNASINFLIYCLWGTKFRRQLVLLCSKVFCKPGAILRSSSRSNHSSQSTLRNSSAVTVTGL